MVRKDISLQTSRTNPEALYLRFGQDLTNAFPFLRLPERHLAALLCVAARLAKNRNLSRLVSSLTYLDVAQTFISMALGHGRLADLAAGRESERLREPSISRISDHEMFEINVEACGIMAHLIYMDQQEKLWRRVCALDHFLRGDAWCLPARDYRAVEPDRSLPLLTDEDIIGRLAQLGVLELAFPTLLKIIRAAQTNRQPQEYGISGRAAAYNPETGESLEFQVKSIRQEANGWVHHSYRNNTPIEDIHAGIYCAAILQEGLARLTRAEFATIITIAANNLAPLYHAKYHDHPYTYHTMLNQLPIRPSRWDEERMWVTPHDPFPPLRWQTV